MMTAMAVMNVMIMVMLSGDQWSSVVITINTVWARMNIDRRLWWQKYL